jgi:HD-GYP domain-containing protein (c-di-GMP phosphodiesterase class II)
MILNDQPNDSPVLDYLIYSIFLADLDTGVHSLSTAIIMQELVRYMKISETEGKEMYFGALLHDLGKTCIPRSILQKPGPLTDHERQTIKLHPQIAYHILYPISNLRSFVEIPFCHHEWWDGNGYPRGLKSEEIPLSARIFAIVDLWDALKSDRPYRRAWDEEKIVHFIEGQAGKRFDPSVVANILPLLKSRKQEWRFRNAYKLVGLTTQ